MSLIDHLANIIFPLQHQYISMILVLQLLFFEDEIIEDQPRKIRADSYVLPKRLIRFLKRAAAERAFSANELIEKYLFLAPWTGCVRGLHA
jgi:hypothetical protein